jgi:hypothetical protein
MPFLADVDLVVHGDYEVVRHSPHSEMQLEAIDDRGFSGAD